jgi:hypothetical protein
MTREFVYAHVTSPTFARALAGTASGTSTRPTTIPNPRAVEAFTCVVAPQLALAQQFRRRIVNLRRTRDILLPRLLSGQLDGGN